MSDFEDLDDPSDDFEPVAEYQEFISPLHMTAEQWEALKSLALVVRKELKCDYAKAIVVAYFRWHDLMGDGSEPH